MSDAPTPNDDQSSQNPPVPPTPATPATPFTPGGYATPAQTPAPGPASQILPNDRLVTPNRPPPGPSRPRNTPAAGSPSDIVNATPAPLTPGVHRRELGVSPVRLTPGSQNAPPGPPSPATPSQETPLVLWGTTINVEDAEMRLANFINSFTLPDASVPVYIDMLQHLAETGASIVNVDMSHLFKHDQGLYRKIVAYPNELITVFDAVVSKIFSENFPEEAQAIQDRNRQALHVRTFNLLSQHVQSMRELNPRDISSMVAVRGMVIRASSIIPDIQRAMYRCNKCQAMKDVMISYGRIDEPRVCASCNTRDSFSLIHSRSSFSDKQMIRLQEAPESVPKGETPATFSLVMYDTLVDAVKPGDRVEVTGILRASPVRVNPKMRTVRSVFRTYIDCVHIRTLNNNQTRFGEKNALGQSEVPMNMENYTEEQRQAREEYFRNLSCHPALYERLAASVAPSIFGMTDEKKGVLLQLFGGSSKSQIGQANGESTCDGAARFRSAINILLVGDPGTSKSQLLHSAHRLAPRGVYTSGRGSSAVGLTAYVTRDPDTDDYVLESGALVLSDHGVCCIDEFDKMGEFARSVLHEAMEQQTVSIAKAGIIATLNARTAVLAAANPVGSRYDTSKSVVSNIDLPPTLLSRFDLIYLVLDAPNADADRRLARHIVSLFFKNYDTEENATGNDAATSGTKDEGKDDTGDLVDDDGIVMPDYTSDLLEARTLTEYIAYARSKSDPLLSTEASDALVNGYLEMRSEGRGSRNITATPRQLESLIRLAEAHARMQLKDEVEASDVQEAMRLVKSALRMSATDPNTGLIDMGLFAAGAGRETEEKLKWIEQAIVDKIGEQGNSEMRTNVLLKAIRDGSDKDIPGSDFREALKRLESTERVNVRSGGTLVALV